MDPPLSPPRISISDRRQAVPLLLSSFPAPPTHIPLGPLTPLSPSPGFLPPASPNLAFINPPLSAPPATPLPPVPGPSPISEHDTLMFMSAARTRRASRISLASSSSRYSTASVVSGSHSHQPHPPPLSPSVSSASLDASNRSLRSFDSSGSLSFPTTRGTKSSSSLKEPRIREEDSADLTRMSLEEMEMSMSIISGMSTHGHGAEMDLETELELGLSEAEEDGESLVEFGLQPSLSKRGKRPAHRDHGPNDSISSIDMRDLPALEEEDQEDDFPMPPPLPPSLARFDRTRNPGFSPASPQPSPSPIVRQFSMRKLNKDLPPLPSASSSKQTIYEEDDRSASPDIRTILESTPKPRRKSASSLNASMRSRSNSRPRRSSTRTKAPRRRVSEPQVTSGSASTTSITITVDSHNGRRSDVIVRSELPYAHNDRDTQNRHEASRIYRGRRRVDGDGDNSDDSDYGVAIDRTGTEIELFDRDLEDRLESQLEGDGSDSDSDIDLHTPLPNLMLRDGMLSPNSKLLPQASRSATPQSMLLGRPGSMMSVASSVMTKTGIYKDQRDTVQRRVRHRDGKLLRGGIGLTTGLGWSDSEDEDAPSPLTRRLSSLALSRKGSENVLRPSGSGSSLAPKRSVSETLKSVSSTLEKHSKIRAAAPPTSWTHSSLRNSTRSSTSTDSYLSGVASTRASTSSFGSSTSRRTSETTKLVLDHIREHEELAHETSSSASTSSLPLPITPADDFTSNEHSWAGLPRKEIGKGNGLASSIKAQSVRRIPSGIPPPGGSGIRARTTSSSSNSSHQAPPQSAPATRTSVPRPLRLPQASALSSSKSTPNTPRTSGIVRSNSDGHALTKNAASRVRSPSGGLGPSPPVSSAALKSLPSNVAASRLARPSMPTLRQPSASASTSSLNSTVHTAAIAERPKPRTGTGMVYRTSSRSTPSVRTPGSSLLRPPMSTGVAV